jgi:hypothetical protein
VVVSRIQHILVLRTPDRANGQALWNPSCFARWETARYSIRCLIPQFAFNGRSHELAARRANASNFHRSILITLPTCQNRVRALS